MLSARVFMVDDENWRIPVSVYHNIYISCFDFHNVYVMPGHAL